MTEITQADRDVASDWLLDEGLAPSAKIINMANGYLDDNTLVQAFARHREYGYNAGYYDGRTATEQEIVRQIVAWLRAFDAPDDFYSLHFADALESGQWKQK